MSEITVAAVELQFTEGSSLKFYRVITVGTTVTYQWGRIGTSGKFESPVVHDSISDAGKTADARIARQIGKGYRPFRSGVVSFEQPPTNDQLHSAINAITPGSEAVAMPQVRQQAPVTAVCNSAAVIDPAVMAAVDAKLSAMGRPASAETFAAVAVPMLATIASNVELAEMLASDYWVAQLKIDGDRALICVEDGQVSVFNRAGQPKVTNISGEMLAPFASLTKGRWIFDGEIVGSVLWLFDMAVADRYHGADADFARRYANLTAVLSVLGSGDGAVMLLPTVTGESAKRDLLRSAEASNKEGIIFRAAAAPYRSGKTPTLRKWKFLREVDAEVIEVGHGGKANAVLAVYGADGQQIVIGQVSTNGKGNIRVGDVLEVAFQNIANLAAPVLFQPRIVRVRTDKSAQECSIDQLAHSVGNKSVTD